MESLKYRLSYHVVNATAALKLSSLLFQGYIVIFTFNINAHPFYNMSF